MTKKTTGSSIKDTKSGKGKPSGSTYTSGKGKGKK